MANTNTLTAVLDRILAQAMPVLRGACVMPRLVNSAYSALAGGKGSTIEISVPGAATATAVTPSNTPPDIAGVTPSLVVIPLDQWYESGFFMSDKDILDMREGVLNAQMQSHVKALADAVNADLLALYKQVYGWSGTAGTTPFASGLEAVAAARKVLVEQLCPRTDLRGVIDPDAEANFSIVGPVLKANERGDQSGIKEGSIGRILGIDWYTDQAVPKHTAGTAAGATTNTAGYAVGVKTVALASAGTGSILEGDVFQFAGDDQTYTVTSGDPDVSNGGSISFEPGLKVAIETSAHAITVKASHAVNLVLNPFAFAFVNRPFSGGLAEALGAATIRNARTLTDPVSGLSMRVEHTYEHRREKLNFDILWGRKCVRPEYATRLAG